MADDLFPDQPIDLQQQINCVKREIEMRHRTYPHWVTNGRIQQPQADYEIKAMNAVLETLRELHANS